MTAIIDAVASLAIQQVKVKVSAVKHQPIRRGIAHLGSCCSVTSATSHFLAVIQFDNPFEEEGVTKVEVVAPTAKIAGLKMLQEDKEEHEEEGEETEQEEEGPRVAPEGSQNGNAQLEKEKVR